VNLRPNAPLPNAVVGAAASVAAVAMVTAAIELLKAHVSVLSLRVLHIFAMLPIAIAWCLASPWRWRSCRRWRWVTAVVVSEPAARSRRQAQESALLARIATWLLKHGSVSAELERIAVEAAQT
jgi:hypothetical protein